MIQNIKQLLFFLIVMTSPVFAQTKVSGKVVDENNNPIPFATVKFQNSKIGIVTEIDGDFTISSESTFKAIEVSFVGFSVKTIELSSSNVKKLVVKLQSGQELDEVVIVRKPKKHLSKKENPAYRILQGIWENKKKNGLKLVKSYDYKKYSSVSIGISNLDSVFLKKTMRKQYDSIVKIIKSGKKDKRFFVPIYMKENYESVYGNNLLKKERIDMEAERSIGVTQNGFIFNRLSDTFSDIDIYEDDIIILNKSFVSPISKRGYEIYDYVLKDSLVENNRKFYQIYFFPRQPGTIAFEGNFTVADKIFSLKEITMRVNKGINMNLVRNLSVEKNFKIINDSIYLPERDFYEGDFTLFTKNDTEKGLYVRNNLVFSEYDLDSIHEDGFYFKETIQTRSNQFVKEDSYWNTVSTKDPDLMGTRKIINELKDNRRIKTFSSTINIISTGYFDVFKNIQFGSFWQTVSNNNVEGLRLRAGFRSFKTPDDLFRAKMYFAYGTKDNKLKYGAEAKYLIFPNPRITIGATHSDDNIQLGGLTMDISNLMSTNNDTNILIARGENFYLSRVLKNSIFINWAIHNNLNFNVTGSQQNIKSASDQFFSLNYSLDGTTIENKINDFNTTLSLSYTPNRINYGFGVEQRYRATLYPTYTLKYTKGIKGVMGSDFNYNKIQASISRPIFLSNLGTLKPYIEVGKAFETLPLPLLYPVSANQSLSIVKNTFSLLDYYDLMTDTYIMGVLNYHLNGFILDKLPLIKKLKLREILFYRTIYGTIRNENIAINHTNIKYEAPSNKMYSEFGFGIENIGYGNFRPIRFDFIWRSSFTNVNGPESPNFGVRVGINPDF